LSVTAGLRYSHETNKSWLIGATTPVTSTFNNTSPHVGLNYQVTDAAMLYVKASKGFRAGGVTANGALPGGGLAFDPETAWTYEAGARLEFFDRRLRINPTVFQTDWKEIQFNVLIPTASSPVAATSNAGDARIKGFELESQFAATNRLTLVGTVSLLDGYYTTVPNLMATIYPLGFPAFLGGVPGSIAFVPNISLGTPLQRAPKSKFSGGVHYAYPFASGSKLVTNVDYAWTAKQRSSVTIVDAVNMPSYGVLNARLQYEAARDAWSVALFGTNLTDKHYLVGGVDFAGGYTVGVRELDPARPREFGVELKVNF
jgi:iron complex outermembrane receptor protein